MAKKAKATDNNTPVVNFRLPPEVLAQLDEIASALSAEQNRWNSRTDALKWAVGMAHLRAKKILEKLLENT